MPARHAQLKAEFDLAQQAAQVAVRGAARQSGKCIRNQDTPTNNLLLAMV